jgi:UDP-2,4-diacetamido-2,4,6-trideoxy-beta-L-altropyranose hydrolase
VKRIFIFFGGSDETNETMTALISFLQLKRKDISAEVVVGQTNPHRQELYSICHQYEHVNFHYQISNMAELMSKADLSIGAGGTTTWERCFLALPSIVISVAKNQEEICETLAKWNVIKYVGKKEAVSPSLITNHIQSLLENEKERTEMSRLSYQLMKDTFINQKSMITELLRLG